MKINMNLYKVSQNVNCGYDTYDSMVVAAEDEESAKRIHPSSTWKEGGSYDEEKKGFFTTNVSGIKYLFENEDFGSWTNDLSKISVTFIGVAAEGVEKGVICSSFNAG